MSQHSIVDRASPTARPRAGAARRIPALAAHPGRPRVAARASRVTVKVLVALLLAALAAAIVYPLIWMLLSGMKSNAQIFSNPWGLPSPIHWRNFADAWDQGVVRYLLNSVIVTVASIVGVTLCSAWAAYGLSRVRIPLGQPILLLILGGLMLSPTVALVPLFNLLHTIHLYNTLWALMILYTAFRIPFTMFLIRGYMLGLSKEIEEAAFIDGAGRWRSFWSIILPLCRPILVSAALLQALFAWNEFAFALAFLNSDSLETLPVGLVNMESRLTTNWAVVFAGLTIASIPMIVVFLVGQRHFIRGLADGSGK